MELSKIIVAPDSFKGSLTSHEAAVSIGRGIVSVFPACEVVTVGISDGGEGMAGVLVDEMNGSMVEVTVSDPLMRPVTASYGLSPDGNTAIVETAAASGLVLVGRGSRNPMVTTTFGTGEMIRDALLRGCRRFLVGIGGSATNDAGTGMLQALGYRFLDRSGNEPGQGGRILPEIVSIDASGAMPQLAGAEFIAACDVDSPFSGPAGAAYTYAPQKGADRTMVEALDAGLRHFASVIRDHNGVDVESIKGSGAAGGMGGAFAAFLNASLVSGIELVLDAVDFSTKLDGADLVITGEGRLDAQTAMGKAPKGVLDAAKARGIPVIAIGGALEEAGRLNDCGFTAVFPVIPSPVSLEQAMNKEYAGENIRRTTEQLMRVIRDIGF